MGSFLIAFCARLRRYTSVPYRPNYRARVSLVDIPEKLVPFERAKFIGGPDERWKPLVSPVPSRHRHLKYRLARSRILHGSLQTCSRFTRSAFVDGNHLINRYYFRPKTRMPFTFLSRRRLVRIKYISRFTTSYERTSYIHAIKHLRYFLKCIEFKHRFENYRVFKFFKLFIYTKISFQIVFTATILNKPKYLVIKCYILCNY